MAISGIFYGATGNAWIKPRIVWSAQSDTEGNYSDVTATLSYTRTNTGYTTSGHWAGSLSINGSTKSASGVYVQITDGGYTATVSHTVRVYHADDGTKTIRISAAGSISGTTLTYTSIGADVALEAIPRAASIAATDADIGAVSMVTIGKKSELYTYTVAYSFGSLEGFLTEDGISDAPVQLTQANLAFSLPEEFYYEIPEAPSGSCTLTCTTYLEDAVIGSPQQASFTVRADPQKCGPLLTVQAQDENPVTVALTGNAGSFVRYASQVLCSLSCQSRFGAQITEKRIAGSAVTEDSLLLEGIDTSSLRFSVRDSRGYIAEQTLTAELIPYCQPTGSMHAERTDPTSGNAVVQAQGTWFSGSFGACDNTLQVRCRVGQGDWQMLEVQTDGDTYTVSGELTGLTYTDAHTVTVEVSDCITSLTLSTHVNPGIPVFDWGKEDFCFHVPVTAQKVTGLADPEEESDAANKSYVDQTAQAVKALADGKLSMTLVWENASPTSAFATQTVSLNWSGYDMILIIAPSCSTMVFAELNMTGQLNWTLPNDNGTIVTTYRNFTVVNGGITFGTGYTISIYGTLTQNERIRPRAIYGIKGVIA